MRCSIIILPHFLVCWLSVIAETVLIGPPAASPRLRSTYIQGNPPLLMLHSFIEHQMYECLVCRGNLAYDRCDAIVITQSPSLDLGSRTGQAVVNLAGMYYFLYHAL
jgi:hypothetical protein